MPVEVEDADGTIIEFPDGTPQRDILRVMRRRNEERQARTRAGANGPGGIVGAIAARAGNRGPQTDFDRGGAARARERAPRGAPGSIQRGLSDFNRNGPAGAMDQMWRNVGIADEVAYGSEFLRSGGNSERARGAMEYERGRQRQVAREQPILNAASIAASIPAMGGTGVPGRVSALAAGGGTALVNTPFALARQDGDFMERLPGAAQETAAVLGLGTALQGGANLLTRNSRPATSMGARAGQFEDAGVRPTIAAISSPRPRPGEPPVTAEAGGGASFTRAIAENPVAGIRTRGHLRDSLSDTARGAERIARSFGPRSGVEESGQTIQQGLRRFAMGDGAGAARPAGSIRNYSFDQRANALYDDFEQRLTQAIQQRWGSRGQATPAAFADNARITLDDILGRNSAEVSEELNDPVLRRFRELADSPNLTFRDIRDLRSYVRRLQTRDPSMRPNLSDAALERLERALTQDAYDTVAVLGSPELGRRLLQTDKFYRRGNERITGALRPFLREGTSPAQAYRQLLDSAQEGGRFNTQRLLAVRRSLQPDEWRSFVATTIDEMGRASPGHPFANEGAFSVSEFATRYARMSADGRRALFGDLGSPTGSNAGGNFIDLERALDNLAQVAGMQKAVERAANTSNSAVAAQTAGIVSGAVMAPAQTIGVLTAAAVTGEMLTNPAFVRWLTSASRAGVTPGGMRRQLAALAQIAARDPAIAPYHAELVRRVGEYSLGQEAQPADRSQPAQ